MAATVSRPPAAVASASPIPAISPAALADEAGKRVLPDYLKPVADIAPVDGWLLASFDEGDSDGFITPGYVALNCASEVRLDHCRFDFYPTQERFEYLVRHGFPRLGGIGPTTNHHIDAAIRAERARSTARHGLTEAQAMAIAWVLS